MTVVPDTADIKATSVVLKLLQVMRAIAHCIMVGFVYVILLARVAIIAYVVLFPRIVFARIVSLTNVNQSISVSTFMCAPDAAMDTRAHTQSVKVPPA